MTTSKSTMKRSKKTYSGVTRITKARVLAMSYTAYYIWTSRNYLIFVKTETETTVELLFEEIKVHVARGLYYIIIFC